jgi:peptidoglycan/xylan/chitin deacetylase (PgdA/CDA1 family)
MDWDGVRAFLAAGWEIGAHTYSHPYLTKTETENVADIQMELEYPIFKIRQEIGVTPISFATPFGDYDDYVVHMIQAFYQSHLMIGQPKNGESGVNSSLGVDHYHVTRYPMDNGVDPQFICGKLRDLAAKKSDTWFVMVFHQLSKDDETERFAYSASKLETIASCAADLAAQKKIRTLTVKDALAVIPDGTGMATK